jgi:TcdA/TcdB pore forming domain/OTT_1508-like deaminase
LILNNDDIDRKIAEALGKLHRRPIVNSVPDGHYLDGIAQFLNSLGERDVCIAVYLNEGKLFIAGNKKKLSCFSKALYEIIEDYKENRNRDLLDSLVLVDVVDKLIRFFSDFKTNKIEGMKLANQFNQLYDEFDKLGFKKNEDLKNFTEEAKEKVESRAKRIGGKVTGISKEDFIKGIRDLIEGKKNLLSKLNKTKIFIKEKFSQKKNFLTDHTSYIGMKKSIHEIAICILKSHIFLNEKNLNLLFAIKDKYFVDGSSDKVHAEMKIIEHFINIKSKIKYYIGISKDCCLPCYEVMRVIEIEKNQTRGTHSRSVDPAWEVPNITKSNFKENLLVNFLLLLVTNNYSDGYLKNNLENNLKILLIDLNLKEKEFSREKLKIEDIQELKKFLENNDLNRLDISNKFKQWILKIRIRNIKYNRHFIIQIGTNEKTVGKASENLRSKSKKEVPIFKIGDPSKGVEEISKNHKMMFPQDILISIVVDQENFNVDKLHFRIKEIMKDGLGIDLAENFRWENKISISIFSCKVKDKDIKILFEKLNKGGNEKLINSIVFRRTAIIVDKHGLTQYWDGKEWRYRFKGSQKATYSDEFGFIDSSLSIHHYSGKEISATASERLGLIQDESGLHSSEWNLVDSRTTTDGKKEVLFKFINENPIEYQYSFQDELWIKVSDDEFITLEKEFSKRSLKLALDQNEGIVLTKEFREVIRKIAERNSEVNLSEWIPIIKEIKTGTKLNEKSELLFVKSSEYFAGKSSSEISKWAEINPKEFQKITEYRNYLDGHLNSIHHSSYLQKSLFNIQHVEGVDGLNSYFTIQSIFDLFNSEEEETDNSFLGRSIKAHTFLNYAQLGLSGVHNIGNFYKLIRVANNPNFVLGNKFGKLLGSVGKGLTLINLGFVINDIIKLSYSDITEEQKVIFGTNLFFDSLGLVSVGLGFFASGTAAALAGNLAVPLAGIGIGVTSLIGAYLKANQEAIHYALYFSQYQQDYQNYHSNLKVLKLKDRSILPLSYENAIVHNQEIITSGTEKYEFIDIMPKPYVKISPVVIKKIDLTSDCNVKLELGTNYLFKTNRAEENAASFPLGNYWFSIFGKSLLAEKTKDKEKTINLTKSFGEQKTINIQNSEDNLEIILPVTPEAFIDYGYGGVGLGFRYRNDWELLATDIIQKKEAFSFRFYQFPSESAIRSLKFEIINTIVEIKLGFRNFTFVTPKSDNVDKFTYVFSGGSGTFTLFPVNCGCWYEIKNSKYSSWRVVILDKEVNLSNKQQVKELFKEFKICPEGFGFKYLTIRTKNSLYQIGNDWEPKLIHASGFTSYSEERKYLENVTKNSNYTGFIQITDHILDDNTTVPKAWYDLINKKFIYPNY